MLRSASAASGATTSNSSPGSNGTSGSGAITLPPRRIATSAASRGKRTRETGLPARGVWSGSVTLTSDGVIRPWHHQLDHFEDPTPLPSFGQVVVMLIDLLKGQYEQARHRRDELERQLVVLKDWLTSGCPEVAECLPLH